MKMLTPDPCNKSLCTYLDYHHAIDSENLLPRIFTMLPESETEIRAIGLAAYLDLVLRELNVHGLTYPDDFRRAKLKICDSYIYCTYHVGKRSVTKALHILLAEVMYGGKLPEDYVVHHYNGTFNNNFTNLYAIPSRLHKSLHCFISNPAKHPRNLPVGKTYDCFQRDLFARMSYKKLMAKYGVSNGYINRERHRAGLVGN